MCRYQQYTIGSNHVVFVSERQSIFGSNRHGAKHRKDTLRLGANNYTSSGATVIRPMAMTEYELSNHPGNFNGCVTFEKSYYKHESRMKQMQTSGVLETVADKKLYKTSMAGNYFEAEIVSITDYYPFGSVMQTRSYTARAGRFGFNGKEKDIEVLEGAYAFEARIFDSRLGKFMSLDPRMGEYVWQTPYAYFSNSPVAILDIAGMGGPYQADDAQSTGCAFQGCPDGPASSRSAVGASSSSNVLWHSPMVAPAVQTVNNASQNTQSSSNQGTRPAQANNTGSTATVNQNGQAENPNEPYASDFVGPLPEYSRKQDEPTNNVTITNFKPSGAVIALPTNPLNIKVKKVGDAYYVNVYYDETFIDLSFPYNIDHVTTGFFL